MRMTLNGRVLLLNFSYEALGTIGVARAMCLVFREAVFVEEFDARACTALCKCHVQSSKRCAPSRLCQRAASPSSGGHEAAAHLREG